jgi:hypothetical protein
MDSKAKQKCGRKPKPDRSPRSINMSQEVFDLAKQISGSGVADGIEIAVKAYGTAYEEALKKARKEIRALIDKDAA